MLKKSTQTLILFGTLVLLLQACTGMKSEVQLPAEHPEALEVGKRPTCTGCHESDDAYVPYQRLNHTPLFADNHRQAASQSEQVCNLCHQTSYCNDCHATRVELKPSVKNQTDNFRRLPHRGDYVTRHRIDGRIDPTSCFRCHGNPKSARTCTPCHG